MSRNKIIIKTQEEIDKIRIASKIAAMALDMIEPYVKPGITTGELDHICNTFIMSQGGKSACKGYHGYPKFTCISLNDTICHGIPSDMEVLKEGDIVNIDITVMKDSYFGDTSRMYTVGEVDSIAKKLIETTKEALDIGIAQVYPGNSTGNIGYEIAKYVEGKGFSVVLEYTGHGIGKSMHEDDILIYHKAKKGSGLVIVPGMVFTIEPMINVGTSKTMLLSDKWTVKTVDGKLSAQFEHTIAITSTGYEILSLV